MVVTKEELPYIIRYQQNMAEQYGQQALHVLVADKKEEDQRKYRGLHYEGTAKRNRDGTFIYKNETFQEDSSSVTGTLSVGSVANLEELTEEEERRKKSIPTEDHLWFYRYQKSKIKGPFESDKMLEWYNTGKFHPGMEVRRNCDKRFISLEDMVKLYNRVPFTPGPGPAPLVNNLEERLKQHDELMKQLQQQEQEMIISHQMKGLENLEDLVEQLINTRKEIQKLDVEITQLTENEHSEEEDQDSDIEEEDEDEDLSAELSTLMRKVYGNQCFLIREKLLPLYD